MASMRALDDSDFFVLPAARLRLHDARVVPDGDPPARGPRPGHAQLAGRDQRAAAARRARRAVRRPDARAEQPGRRRRPGPPARCASGSPACGTSSACWPHGKVRPAQLDALVELQEEVIERAAKAPDADRRCRPPTARTSSATGWTSTSVTGGWDLAPVFAQGGIDVDCLERHRGQGRRPGLLDQAMHWLGYALETEQLMTDIEDATGRVSSLVAAAKQYSQMDRAAHQWIDVHAGLDSTLVMLTHKIGNGRQGGQGLRPDAAADPGPSGRAQPGVDQPDRQRGAGHERRRHADAADVPGRRPRGRVDRRHRAGRARGSCASGSSSRSSPPSRWARAPGSAWTSRTGSWSTGTAATSCWSRSRATPGSWCACRWRSPPSA